MDQGVQIALGGMVALLVLREVFAFIRARGSVTSDAKGRPITGPRAVNRSDLQAITDRLDRMIARLDELAEVAKDTRRQAEVTGEKTERFARNLATLEETLIRIEQSAHRRPTSPPLAAG